MDDEPREAGEGNEADEPRRATERGEAEERRRRLYDERQQLGRVGEQLAADHLTRRGYRILERNYRTRWGELDIVACQGRTLVFCEVKTRRARQGKIAAPACGLGPLDSVGPLKREQVRKMAGRWLSERRERPYAALVRFDAIGIRLDEDDRLLSLEHLEDAF